jgi:branched-chain amino acid transport system substrate-binding protein
MSKLNSMKAALVAGGLVGAVVTVQAEPLKIAVVESLSGAQSLVGEQTVTAVRYVVDKVNAKGGYNGAKIEILEYDNQGGASGAADKVRSAIADGAKVIIQGASSAVAAQITEDVRRYNLRNRGKEVLFLNIGGEALELTGDKCHFHHFRFTSNAPIRVKPLVTAMSKAGELGTKVYSINQNYSWGKDMEQSIDEFAVPYKYNVVERVLHDVNRIQDFSPYVARIKQAAPDTVITGNWSNDLLLLMKATGDAGLKVRFGTVTSLDMPGNIANAGDTAQGHYLSSTFNIEAGGAAGDAYAEDFKKFAGHYPSYFEPNATHATQMLLAAAQKADFKGGVIDMNRIAVELENTSIETPIGKLAVRKADHQSLLPIVVSKVSTDAKYKVDGTKYGFKPVLVVSGEDAVNPVQASCKMQRPNGI